MKLLKSDITSNQNPYGQISLKVPNVEFDFDVCKVFDLSALIG